MPNMYTLQCICMADTKIDDTELSLDSPSKSKHKHWIVIGLDNEELSGSSI